ncbi:MAG: lipoyl(octanoyl) transferase LipB [bacterium]|nr:lipoyl(octanoyl) transferase LipB [bacterium]
MLARWLGRIGYAEGLELQERLIAARRRGDVPDLLLLLEHPPVITLGRSSDESNVLLDADALRRRGIEVHEAGRGGDVTYHSPGQLVGYPILALPRERRDAHRYLRDLEQVLIRAAADYGSSCEREPGLTGIWTGGRKLAAIGVRLSTGWITSHGFALNVSTDLDGFSAIVPCGIRDRGVTSLAHETGTADRVRDVAGVVTRHFGSVFGLSPDDRPEPTPALAPLLERSYPVRTDETRTRGEGTET